MTPGGMGSQDAGSATRRKSQYIILPYILYERVRIKVNIYGLPAEAVGVAAARRRAVRGA